MGRALILLAVAALACIAAVAQGYQSDRVLLQDVRTLTLRSGQYTTGRRSAPVPQIKCIGGSAGCNAADIRVMQCNQQYNEQWECKADLPNEVSFGETTVVCEGYDNPNDPYILVGSCGVEYTLEGRPQHNRQHSYSGDHHYNNNYSNQSRSGSSLWSLIVFAFLAFFVYRICFAGPSTPGAPGGAPGRTGWGGGGGGWGGWGGGGGGGGGNTYPPGCAPSSGTGTGGPGFWTGLGVGGILGNLFARPAGGYRPGYATNYGGGFGGGGFGGGGFGGAMGGGGGGGGSSSSSSNSQALQRHYDDSDSDDFEVPESDVDATPRFDAAGFQLPRQPCSEQLQQQQMMAMSSSAAAAAASSSSIAAASLAASSSGAAAATAAAADATAGSATATPQALSRQNSQANVADPTLITADGSDGGGRLLGNGSASNSASNSNLIGLAGSTTATTTNGSVKAGRTESLGSMSGMFSTGSLLRSGAKCVLKDLDFLEMFPVGLRLQQTTHEGFVDQLLNECQLLETYEIMDYSLLLGMHSLAPDSPLAGMADLEVEALTGGRVAYDHNEQRWLLFCGIIDVLQKYAARKKVEHLLKSLIYNSKEVSVCDPRLYSSRFQAFLTEQVFRTLLLDKDGNGAKCTVQCLAETFIQKTQASIESHRNSSDAGVGGAADTSTTTAAASDASSAAATGSASSSLGNGSDSTLHPPHPHSHHHPHHHHHHHHHHHTTHNTSTMSFLKGLLGSGPATGAAAASSSGSGSRADPMLVRAGKTLVRLSSDQGCDLSCKSVTALFSRQTSFTAAAVSVQQPLAQEEDRTLCFVCVSAAEECVQYGDVVSVWTKSNGGLCLQLEPSAQQQQQQQQQTRPLPTLLPQADEDQFQRQQPQQQQQQQQLLSAPSSSSTSSSSSSLESPSPPTPSPTPQHEQQQPQPQPQPQIALHPTGIACTFVSVVAI
eukprot:m.131916 g.131916  ORF g.131916 m.131916 type:complete len:943 (-) comp16474_c4_seq7:739-3567(-)